MICVQFIFKPKVYDADFHRLNDAIDAFAHALEGFIRSESWRSEGGDVNAIYYFADHLALANLAQFPDHLEAKGQVESWYESYRIIVSRVETTYGSSA